MKKIYMMIFAAMAMLLSSCEYDDTALNDRIEDLEERVARLEEICNQINSDVDALQKLIAAVQSQVSIEKIEPLIEDGSVVGTVIRLSNGETFVIHDGKDGADGADGEDGIDGYVPEVGTKTGSDGILYWTIDGKWLLDANGDKVPVSGKDGADGQNGRPGADGKDGNSPLFRIENGMWMVSYTGEDGPWYELGKADGENGQNGSDGDALFQDVIVGTDEVTFVMSDGSEYTLPLTSNKIYHRVTSVVPFQRIDPICEWNPEIRWNFNVLIRPGVTMGEGRASYMISPKEAVKDIAADWENMLKFEGFMTEYATRAADLRPLKILDFSADEETGMISFTFDLEHQFEGFYMPDWFEEGLFVMLRVCDGKNEICSEATYTGINHFWSRIDYIAPDFTQLEISYMLESHWIEAHMFGEEGDVILNHPIASLEKEIFENRKDITSVTLTDFRLIEDGTFRDTPNLKVIKIKSFILDAFAVGVEAFASSGIETAELRSDRVELRDRAFYNCQQLQTMTLFCPPPKLGTDVFGDHIPVIKVRPERLKQYLQNEDWAPYKDYIEEMD